MLHTHEVTGSSPVVSTKPLKAKCFQGFFFFSSRNQTSCLLPHFWERHEVWIMSKKLSLTGQSHNVFWCHFCTHAFHNFLRIGMSTNSFRKWAKTKQNRPQNGTKRKTKNPWKLSFSRVLAEDEGFEPPQTESESGVLPLHKSSIWWRQQDSNLWPHACEACALTSWAMPPCRNRMYYTTFFKKVNNNFCAAPWFLLDFCYSSHRRVE